MEQPDIVLVTVRAEIVRGHSSTQLGEQFNVKAGSLDEVLSVLNRFHELAEQIRDEQAGLSLKVG